MSTSSFCLGLMSGTSMDGIDAALIKTDGEQDVNPIANLFFPYPPIFQRALKLCENLVQYFEGDLKSANHCFAYASKDILIRQWQYSESTQHDFWHALTQFLKTLHIDNITLFDIITASTRLHAQAVKALLAKANLEPCHIDYIGYHGQTFFHNPAVRLTIQAGNAQLLANLTNIDVIADFRLNDVAQGGQGAPFAPIYHWALVQRDKLLPAAVINCGGITNITFITHMDSKQLVAFDCGPGNVLLDRWVRLKTQDQFLFDKDGEFAKQGQVDNAMIKLLYQTALPQNFLNQQPPKSLDSRDCQWPKSFLDLSLEDGCATLAHFTALCLIDSLRFIEAIPQYFILAGGGWHNPAILSAFTLLMQQQLKQEVKIVTAKQIGWQQDALEAEAFAYLAKRSVMQLPLSFPGTTAAPRPLSGGKLFIPNTNT